MYIRDSQISVLMAKSHAKLSLALNRLVDGVNMSQKTRLASFVKFKETILNHFWIEESSIFGLLEQDKKFTETARQLYREHQRMKGIIKDIERELTEGINGKLGEFMSIMRNHTRLENEIFYPYLDMRLPEEKRDEVLVKIKNEL